MTTQQAMPADSDLFKAQIRLWIKQRNSAVGLVNLVLVAVTTFMVWGIQSPGVTLGWCMAGILLFLLRYAFFHRYLHLESVNLSDVKLARLSQLSTFLAGLHWGMCALLFLDPERVEVFLFLVSVICAVTAGSLPSMSVYLPIYIAYIVPVSVLTVWALLDVGMVTLSALLLMYMAIFVNLARNMGNTANSIITLDSKNAHLVVEVTKARDLAEAANLAKSRFLAAASHDLRQPLHAMGMLLHALGGRIKAEEDQSLLSKIMLTHENLDELFNTLLELSRLDSGEVTPTKGHFPLSRVIEPLIQEFESKALKKQITLQADFSDTVIVSDRMLLSRILRNIISNAINYTEKGGVTISVHSDLADRNVKVEVSDTGIGIAPEAIDSIFDEYQQLNNAERNPRKGFGLGLSVVKRMAQLLGHELSVDSQPDVGSRFSVTLPLGEPDQVIQYDELPAIHSLAKLKIIVIDDDVATLEGMRLTLAGWQCESLLCESLDEAIAEIDRSQFDFDLIISDYRLTAGQTGLHVIDTLRRRYRENAPGLIISGDTDPELLRSIRKQGYFLLHKPLKPAHLNKVIHQLTD